MDITESTAPSAGEGRVAVGVAQFAPTADHAGNIAVIRDLAERAAARGARVVLFPEYASAFIDPFDATLRSHAEPLDGAFVGALREIAGDTGTVLVAGLLETADDEDRVRNTIVAVSSDGIQAVSRKQHLYDAFGQRESDWVQPGPAGAPETFAVDGLVFAMMTCYDLRFPEVARTLVDAGAHAVLVPAEWVRGPLKEHHWRTLLQARAIENTVFVAAADHPPPLGVGWSMLVDPSGVVLAGLGTTTDIAVAVCDRGEIERVREVNPALSLRRYRVSPVR